MDLQDWKDLIKIKCETSNKSMVFDILTKKVTHKNQNDKLTVLLAFLGSQYYYEKLKRIHPNWDIYVVDDVHFSFAYSNISKDRLLLVNIDDIYEPKSKKDLCKIICEGFNILNFDYILMNPPYDGNLHLKIVEKAIELLKDDNSICVNLSPWVFTDPMADYRGDIVATYKKTFSKKLEDIGVVPIETAKKMFGDIKLNTDLAIYVFRKNGKSFDFSPYIRDISIAFKVLEHKNFHPMKPKVTIFNDNKYFVPLTLMQALWAKRKNIVVDLTVLTDGYTENNVHYIKARKNGGRSKEDRDLFGINEPTFEKAKNCYNLMKTKFFQYLVDCTHTHSRYLWNDLPYLGDIENPRTHLMGYESDWTNEDLCKVFGITGYKSDDEGEPGSEWETILETMKPYLENKNEKD